MGVVKVLILDSVFVLGGVEEGAVGLVAWVSDELAFTNCGSGESGQS